LRSAKGARLYSREDVARLALIKRLVDAGHAIGSIARLTLAQLQERLATVAAPAPAAADASRGPCRVALLGEALPVRLRQDADFLAGIDLVAFERDRGRFREAVRLQRPEVIVLEYPTVHEETAAEALRLLEAAGASRAIVVYAFGRAEALRRLETSQLTALRAPIEPVELRRWCLAASASARAPAAEVVPSLTQAPPPPRFDADVLAELASTSTTVRCECPHHLVQLVYSLSAFERYSAECESRNLEDAALHAYLHLTTARARALIEEALARVAETEGLLARGPEAGSAVQ
jgi:DNA-binding transcriptional MerR regulator